MITGKHIHLVCVLSPCVLMILGSIELESFSEVIASFVKQN